MLVKNPYIINFFLNCEGDYLSDLHKLLHCCILCQDHKGNFYNSSINFFQRLKNAVRDIEDDFRGIQESYDRFIQLIYTHNLNYSRNDNEYWYDIYKYIIGEKALRIIDNHKRENYVLSVYPLPEKEISIWKDIRKLRPLC